MVCARRCLHPNLYGFLESRHHERLLPLALLCSTEHRKTNGENFHGEFSENYPKGQNPKKYDVKAMNKHYLEETGRKFNLNKNKDSIDDEDCRVGCTTNGCQAKPTPTSSETDTKWADKPKPLRPNVQLCTDWRGLQKTGDMSTTCLNNPKCDSDAALKSAEAFKAPRDTSLKKGCGSVATLDDPDLTAEKCWALQRSIDPKAPKPGPVWGPGAVWRATYMAKSGGQHIPVAMDERGAQNVRL